MSYAFTAALLGLSLAVFIVILLRRDQLYLREAMFWLVTAAVSMLFAVMPSTVDWLGGLAGVAYPPALILALVCAVLTVKALLADVAQTQLRREVRRLNQRVALMDAEGHTRDESSRSDAHLNRDTKSPASTLATGVDYFEPSA